MESQASPTTEATTLLVHEYTASITLELADRHSVSVEACERGTLPIPCRATFLASRMRELVPFLLDMTGVEEVARGMLQLLRQTNVNCRWVRVTESPTRTYTLILPES